MKRIEITAAELEARRPYALNPNPPGSITGGKLKTAPTITFDWATFVCDGPDEEWLTKTRVLLNRMLGPSDAECGPRNFYAEGERWENGVTLRWGHKSAGPLIAFPGTALGELDVAKQIMLLRELFIGRRCTRLDIAADFKSSRPIGLIDRVRAETADVQEAGRVDPKGRMLWQLAGAKVVEPFQKFDGPSCKNWGIAIGVRGSDGSGRFLRVYDKGVQTGEAPKGHWERWEVEFSGDVATEVMRGLFYRKSVVEVVDLAWRYAFGAVDFLEVKTRSRGREAGCMVSRGERARAPWWRRIVGMQHLCKPKRPVKKSTLAGVRSNVQNALRQVFAVADMGRIPRRLLFEWLQLGMDDPKPNRMTRRLVEELLLTTGFAGLPSVRRQLA